MSIDTNAQLSPLGRLERGKQNIRQINIDQITGRSKGQTRVVDFDPETVPEDAVLLDSVRKNGIVVPVMLVEVLEDDDDPLSEVKYSIVYGHRRIAAASLAGLSTVPAIVAPDEIDAEFLTFIENEGSRRLTGYEQGLFITKYIDQKVISLREFSRKTGYSIGYLSELTSAFRVVQKYEELLPVYKSGIINYRSVIKFGASLDEMSEEERTQILNSLKGMPAAHIKQLVNEQIDDDVLPPLETMHITEDNPTDGTGGNPESVSAKKIQKTVSWEKQLQTPSFISGKSKSYSLPKDVVEKTVQLCMEQDAQPQMLDLYLLYQKKGKSLDANAVDNIGKMMEMPKLGKAVTGYVSAYGAFEKMQSACLKAVKKEGAENNEIKEILKTLLDANN